MVLTFKPRYGPLALNDFPLFLFDTFPFFLLLILHDRILVILVFHHCFLKIPVEI